MRGLCVCNGRAFQLVENYGRSKCGARDARLQVRGRGPQRLWGTYRGSVVQQGAGVVLLQEVFTAVWWSRNGAGLGCIDAWHFRVHTYARPQGSSGAGMGGHSRAWVDWVRRWCSALPRGV